MKTQASVRKGVLLLAVLALQLAVGCALLRPVTSAGAPVDDPTAIGAANAISRAEAVFATSGKIVLAEQHRISTEHLARIAAISQSVEDALTTAQVALKAYVNAATDANQDALARALSVLKVLNELFAKEASSLSSEVPA